MASATSSSAAERGPNHGSRRWWPSGMRMRIAISVTAVLIILILAQAFSLVSLYEDLEEEFIEDILDEQLSYSIARSRELGMLVTPQTPDMQLFRLPPGGKLPQGLSHAMAALPVGNHEHFEGSREFHVAVRDVDGMHYILSYDESKHVEREASVATTVVIGALLMIALSFLLVYALAGQLTQGLERLAVRVAGEPDGKPFAGPEQEDELLAVARALDIAEARQAALLARERAFNAHLSHELRTPLAGIRSDAEILLADPALTDKAQRRAERIIATVDRTTSLAHTLLLLARETLPQTIERVNLTAAVRDTWHRLHPQGDATSALTLDLPVQASIEADPTLLHLLLRNLLENALLHGQGAAIEVRLQGATLSVSDRGPGFGEGDPMLCFERFRRAGSHPGHGLGLSLVKHICDSCGWKVSAGNRHEGGAWIAVDFGPHVLA